MLAIGRDGALVDMLDKVSVARLNKIFSLSIDLCSLPIAYFALDLYRPHIQLNHRCGMYIHSADRRAEAEWIYMHIDGVGNARWP